jgi:D-psicose/D-tagatose/L-ribulose 3-epimerase
MLELALMDPEAFDVKEARAVFEDIGISVSGSLGLTPSTDVSSEDELIVAKGEAVLRKAVQLVAELGGTDLCGELYSALAKYPSASTEKGRGNAVAALRRLADYADGFGVSLSLEILNRYETNLVNTAEQGLKFLDDVGRPNVKLHLDTYHMNIEESSMAGAVLATGDRLGYVHVGESNRGYLGSGNIDFASFLRALMTIGYAGPIVFESFSTAVVGPNLSNVLGVWRNLWEESDDLASHAYSYITTAIRSAEQATRKWV